MPFAVNPPHGVAPTANADLAVDVAEDTLPRLGKIATLLRMAPDIRQIAAGDDWAVSEFVCHAGPPYRPFEESHGKFTIAAVREGSFVYGNNVTGRFETGAPACRSETADLRAEEAATGVAAGVLRAMSGYVLKLHCCFRRR